MSSAVPRVFATPELLECILIYLPLESLLQAQLTSRSFNALIRTSPTLSQLLFLHPNPPSAAWHLNPLLRQHFPPFFFIGDFDLCTGTTISSFRFMKWTHNASSRSAFLRKEASWRNMLVVQPPPAILLVSRGTYHVNPETGSYRMYDATYEEPGEEVANVPFERGVTMGMIYDIVLSFLGKDPEGAFSLAFESIAEGVRIVLRLYSVVSCDIDEHDEEDWELYESEGRQVGVDDLEWRQVERDCLDDELRLSEMYNSWGRSLTKEKGGMLEQDFWKQAHRARIQEFLSRRD